MTYLIGFEEVCKNLFIIGYIIYVQFNKVMKKFRYIYTACKPNKIYEKAKKYEVKEFFKFLFN